MHLQLEKVPVGKEEQVRVKFQSPDTPGSLTLAQL